MLNEIYYLNLRIVIKLMIIHHRENVYLLNLFICSGQKMFDWYQFFASRNSADRLTSQKNLRLPRIRSNPEPFLFTSTSVAFQMIRKLTPMKAVTQIR